MAIKFMLRPTIQILYSIVLQNLLAFHRTFLLIFGFYNIAHSLRNHDALAQGQICIFARNFS